MRRFAWSAGPSSPRLTLVGGGAKSLPGSSGPSPTPERVIDAWGCLVSGDSDGPVVPEPTVEEREADPVLRAKYVDFCSAQLTEVFLSLSDERIYALVEEAARAEGLQPGALGFRTMVRLATTRLRESVPLPDFETWSRDYEANPDRYDMYLIGFWKELVAQEPAGSGG